MTSFSLGNPVAAVAVPITMLVAADALFAHLCRVYFTAAAPAPANGAEMVTTGGLITHRADDTVGQGTAAGLAPP